MSSAVTRIQLALNAIATGSVSELTKYLASMYLERLEAKQERNLLLSFLTAAERYNQEDIIQPIFEAWTRVYPNNDKMPHYDSLFLDRFYPVKILIFLARSPYFEEKNFAEIMINMIQYDSSPNIPVACQRLIEVYGNFPGYYPDLMKLAEDSGNDMAYEFLVEKLEKNAEYEPIPKWVSNFPPFEETPYTDELVIPEYKVPAFETPTPDVLAKLMLKGLSEYGLDTNYDTEELDLLIAKIALMSDEERTSIMKSIITIRDQDILESNEELFRILGPANPIPETDPEDVKYGGERMFLCQLFDYDEESGYTLEWFRGACNQCHKRIRKNFHAVRTPIVTGGWVGCFCSWDCVREAHQNENDRAFDTLINDVEESMHRIGIQDRLDRDETELTKRFEGVEIGPPLDEIPVKTGCQQCEVCEDCEECNLCSR